MPEFGISEQSGYRLLNSFFLTLGRSRDATFDLEYYSKRGLKHGLEYRQSFKDQSDMIFRGNFIRDREFRKDYDIQSRYAVDHVHQYYF